ncbi:MAG: GNAT family N-acetyltransferase, partial [Bacteroidetes bacterium]
LVYQHQQPIACAYFQTIRFHVGQTMPYTRLGKGHTLKEQFKNRMARAFKNVAEKWEVTLLVGGNAFLSCESSHHYFDPSKPEMGIKYLIQSAHEIARREKGISGILLKDFYHDTSPPVSLFTSAGFHPFQAEPNMLLQLRPEWHTFEDYLKAMTSKYRQRAKSAYKKSQALSTRQLQPEELRSHKGRMHQLFREVVKSDKFSLVEPGEDYFIRLQENMGDAFRVYGYFLEDELVAFISTMLSERHLEAHFIGYETSLNREMKIYQRILYDLVEKAIEMRVKTLSFGRTALEIKSCVGAEPRQMDIYLKLVNPFINRLAGPVMRSITTDEWEQRHPFK